MCEYESRDEYYRCGRIRSSDEVSVVEMEQRDSVVGTLECNNQNWEDYMKEGKEFQISQNEVLNAYKAVKTNKGAGGVDGMQAYHRVELSDLCWQIFLCIMYSTNG